MINDQLNENFSKKLDYKYEIRNQSVMRANMDDLIEKQQKGLIYGFIPGVITGLVLCKKFKFSFSKSILGGLSAQYLFFSLYSYRQFKLYEAVSHKINSKISEDINLMMNLK